MCFRFMSGQAFTMEVIYCVALCVLRLGPLSQQLIGTRYWSLLCQCVTSLVLRDYALMCLESRL